VAETWSGGPINGPWDLTAKWTERGADLFVTNVLNGTVAANGSVVKRGTVVRINVEIERGDTPKVTEETVIGRGFPERTDPAALVVGPTGVALNDDGTLYVADTAADRIAAIPDAVHRDSAAMNGGHTVTTGNNVKAPLGLVLAPNDDILTVNGGDGNVVETTPAGTQLATAQLDSSGSPPGAGALFDLALAPHGRGVLYVDDATNMLSLFH
jgi:hypothetical protein